MEFQASGLYYKNLSQNNNNPTNYHKEDPSLHKQQQNTTSLFTQNIKVLEIISIYS